MKNEAKKPDPILTLLDAAEYLNMASWKLRVALSSGACEIPFHRHPAPNGQGAYYFYQSELSAYLDKKARKTSEVTP